MPQFFIGSSFIKNGQARITGADARHISKVLRLKKGDWLILSDGKGGRWRGEIISSAPKEVSLRIDALEPLSSPGKKIRLCQALIKHDRFEWVIQKSVELGCSEIQPFYSERTIPKFSTGKTIRWQKIANEAAKQCGAVVIPVVKEPVRFIDMIRESKGPGRRALLFYEGEDKAGINKMTFGDDEEWLELIIGPEGGFAPGEIKAAKDSGVAVCSLGPLILRVETASLAALTLAQNRLGYFDPRSKP